MSEIWKDVYCVENGIEYNYRGLYLVSSEGNVKILNYNKTGKEKVLKLGEFNGSYLQVNLCKNGKQKRFLVHRLVAFMFLENDDPTEKREVNRVQPIDPFTLDGIYLNTYYQFEYVQLFGFNQGNILHCYNGRYKSTRVHRMY